MLSGSARAFLAVVVGIAAACEGDGNESEAESEAESDADASEPQAETGPCPQGVQKIPTACDSRPNIRCCWEALDGGYDYCGCNGGQWSCGIYDCWDNCGNLSSYCDYYCWAGGCNLIEDGH